MSVRHWELLGEAPIPDTDRSLCLYRGKDDFFIKISGGGELMNSRAHGSEDALGTLPCQQLRHAHAARVLIGGLGMGFTLAAVLSCVGAEAEVTVAELIPEVVAWNRGPLGARSGRPLDDERTRVYLGDVVAVLREKKGFFDVIALDVDNGPEGLTRSSNNWLYTMPGIVAAQNALKPDGILAYWSAGPEPDFHERLRRCGFLVREINVRSHGKKGARHIIWLASLN